MAATGSGWAKLAHRVGCGFGLFCQTTGGAATLAPVFSDHAILQRDRPLPIWGRADPREVITVTFRDRTVATTTHPNGRWMLVLDPLSVNERGAELIVNGHETRLVVRDVLVGDVWLISGQSNMEWPVRKAQDAAREIAAADFPRIREVKIDHAVATAVAESVNTSGWRAASCGTVGEFSAVGYYFAREIHRATGVPIGIVNCTYGGTNIEAWMSDEARASTSVAAKLERRWTQARQLWPPEKVAAYRAEYAAWEQAELRANATDTKNPLPWPPPPATDDSPARPGGLFNAMVAPLQPVALRGILWYQAEGNEDQPEEYAELFTTLIRSWRDGWTQPGLPFYFVQLPNYETDRDWAALREAQAAALALPATGMAVTIDIGEPGDIHPRNKQEVGRRLALIARARTHGESVACTGPTFKRVTREGRKLRVYLDCGDDGLLVHTATTPGTMMIAGADQVFHPADVESDGETLLVSSPTMKEPIAVRYAWSSAPVAGLFNRVGLPAAPFRSDDW
jgi:sialate O-acetylesterase